MLKNVFKSSGLIPQKEFLLCPLIWGLFVIFGACEGWSQATSTRVTGDIAPAPKSVTTFSSAQQRSIFGQVRFESLQYLTSLEGASHLTNSQFLSGRITAASYERNPLSFNWAADISAGTFFSLKQSLYSVQELYIATPISDRSNISAGRKKYDWSEIDRIWALGVWQPRYAIDALRPEDQGLTGFFWDYSQQNFQIVAFGSPLYIPTVGPEIREEDGQLKSDNRWFRPPSSKAGNIDLTYKIDKGDTWKLMQQQSYGMRMRFGDRDLGPWMSVAGGRKPVNEILFERCIHCVPPDGPAEFVVSPRVAHHDIYSSDIGYQFETWRVSASYLEDIPEIVKPAVDHAIQKIAPVKIYSVQLDWNVKEMLGRPLQIQAAYLRSAGEDIQDIEANGLDADHTLFRDRFRFAHAALFKVVGELTTIRARPLVTKLGYLREFDQKGAILGLELQYQWNRTWSFLTGIDTLGVEKNNGDNDGFISAYRANDRIYAGASYVF